MVGFRSLLPSQSPQTGQVYFNETAHLHARRGAVYSLNPLKRVKFISILYNPVNWDIIQGYDVSIPSNGSSLFQ